METAKMNIIENNINKLNNTNVMVIEFYDAFQWPTNRKITKVEDNLYKVEFTGVNGLLLSRNFNKEKLMEVIENSNVFNSYITTK